MSVRWLGEGITRFTWCRLSTRDKTAWFTDRWDMYACTNIQNTIHYWVTTDNSIHYQCCWWSSGRHTHTQAGSTVHYPGTMSRTQYTIEWRHTTASISAPWSGEQGGHAQWTHMCWPSAHYTGWGSLHCSPVWSWVALWQKSLDNFANWPRSAKTNYPVITGMYLTKYQTAIHDCTQHTKHTAETTLFSDYYLLAANSLH